MVPTPRLSLLTATLALCLTIPVLSWADKIKLHAAEIEELLTGNTVDGTWAGSEYMSYFGTDGVTVYVPDEGASDKGKWRVDPENDAYESWWSSTGWTPYGVLQDGDTYYWVDSDGEEHPFVILEGKQVSW